MKSRNSKEYSYTFAGVKVYTNKLINELPIDGFSDINLKIIFKKQKYFQINKNDSTDDSFLKVPEINNSNSYISNDGKTSIIIESNAKYMDYAFEIRNVLPYSSIIQNKLILHASAILKNGRVYAFIGCSGAGKTTLAKRLNALDFQLLSDDLLPCRFDQSGVKVPAFDKKLQKTLFFPLDSIFFLNRDVNLVSLKCEVISNVECFNKLMVNGYGDLKLNKVWMSQFYLYNKIIENVEAYYLNLPDDISILDNSIFILNNEYL